MKKERERENERTNDTTQRYVDDVVRKCVEVKTSEGHCTTGFGDLVEINCSPPRESAMTRTRWGRGVPRRSCLRRREALTPKVPRNARGMGARDGMKSARKHGLSSKRKSMTGQWAPRHQTDNSSGSFRGSEVPLPRPGRLNTDPKVEVSPFRGGVHGVPLNNILPSRQECNLHKTASAAKWNATGFAKFELSPPTSVYLSFLHGGGACLHARARTCTYLPSVHDNFVLLVALV